MEKRWMLYFLFVLIFILFMNALCKITSSLSCWLILVLQPCLFTVKPSEAYPSRLHLMKINYLNIDPTSHFKYPEQKSCKKWTGLTTWSCSPWVLLAQWIEWPPGVREVMGSILVRDSGFFFIPRSCYVDQLIFDISLPSLKFTILVYSFTNKLIICILNLLVVSICNNKLITVKLNLLIH